MSGTVPHSLSMPHVSHSTDSLNQQIISSLTTDESQKSEKTNIQTEDFFGCAAIFQTSREDYMEKIRVCINDGPNSVLLVTDFDFTLSKFHMNGQRGASCHGVIEQCGLLGQKYHENAKAVQEKYYPLEVDPTLDEITKMNYMVEWVHKTNEVLMDSGLTRSIISQAVKIALDNNRIKLRKGVDEFILNSQKNKIPLLIFSAGVEEVLQDVIKTTIPIDPLYTGIISNRFIFDKTNDHLIGFEEPVIHVFNKRSSSFLHTDFFNQPNFSSRSNLILIGDSLTDTFMSEGINYKNIIRIGFLNDRVEDRLHQYLEKFDIVILGDPDSFEIPCQILQAICQN
eukprot:gene11448-15336_t